MESCFCRQGGLALPGDAILPCCPLHDTRLGSCGWAVPG